MDRYQENLMNGIRFELFDTIKRTGCDIAFENDTLRIIQDKDFTHSEYLVYIARNNSIISKVEVFENGEYREPPQYTPIKFFDGSTFYRKDLVVNVNFNFQSITKIRVHFVDDLADPLEITIEYVSADKEQYYKEKERQKRLELIDKMKVAESCGNDLVTIRFQNCSNSVKRTQITLFDKSKQLMGIFKVEEEVFYKSIINLAFGSYFYKVSQYDKNDDLIVETEYIEFRLTAPNYGNYRHVVTPH